MWYFINVLFFAFASISIIVPSSSIILFTDYSNAVGCTESLGMKSRLISDNQLSASSAFRTWGIDTFTWLPHYARLDKQGKTNAWSPASNNHTEWLQVTCASVKFLSSQTTVYGKLNGFAHLFIIIIHCWINLVYSRLTFLSLLKCISFY